MYVDQELGNLLRSVIPAKARIQRCWLHNQSHWIPAFAGMTLRVGRFQHESGVIGSVGNVWIYAAVY